MGARCGGPALRQRNLAPAECERISGAERAGTVVGLLSRGRVDWFADGVLLAAVSADVLEGMLAELAREAAKVGLQLHYGRTKATFNKSCRSGSCRETLRDEGRQVEVVRVGATAKYLGRALRLDCHNEAELDNRINMAWRRFMGLKLRRRRRLNLCRVWRRHGKQQGAAPREATSAAK